MTDVDILNEIVESDSNTLVTDKILNAYALRFDKTYENDEIRSSALRNLKLAVERVREKNGNDHGSATFGLNQFSDMHPDDFKAYYLNYASSSGNDGSQKYLRTSSSPSAVEDVTGSFDWRDTSGVVSDVKNQNRCGSCWAFSAVETVESAFVLAGNEPRILSTEQLVDCDGNDKGCTGGDSRLAYAYIKSVGGVLSESDYPDTSPDTGVTGTCEIGDKVTNDTMTSPLVQVDSFGFAIPPCTSFSSCASQNQYEDDLAVNLKTFGPASVCVSAQWGWQDYIGGVLDSENCKNGVQDMDHCVQLVGYDADASTPYWIIRNTWTSDWGEKGYIRIAMGSNMCGVANEAMQVTASEGRNYLPDATVGPGPGPNPDNEYETTCRQWLWDDVPTDAKFCNTTDLVCNTILICSAVVLLLLIASCILRCIYQTLCGTRRRRPAPANNEPLLLSDDEVLFVYSSDQ